jgi:hypothetical protein
MNTTVKMLLIGLIIATLMGCSNLETATPDESTSGQTEFPGETELAYPVNTDDMSNQAYPLENRENTEIPAYLLPGFSTATPDPAMVDIIISEVKHENGLEIIVIKNIAEKTIDISSFMIYSPAFDDRKILPQNLFLESGDTFELYNGPESSEYPESQRWLTQTILNQALDEVWLLNDAARIIYYFVYYPSVPE